VDQASGFTDLAANLLWWWWAIVPPILMCISWIVHLIRRLVGTRSPKRWIGFELLMVLVTSGGFFLAALSPGDGVVNGLVYGMSIWTLMFGPVLIFVVRVVVELFFGFGARALRK
jgi:hypothetical protein